jgi:uncharacterized protein YbjT (DUF2867 family)
VAIRILLIGASGFIGGRIAARLEAAGHVVVRPGRCNANLARDDAEDWAPRLVGIDAVINAAGLLRGDLEGVHHRGPRAVFDACAAAGVTRVLQISALGAEVEAATTFLRSKGAADTHLLRLRQHGGWDGWCVLRPGLVVGRGGSSTGLFAALAALPRPLRLGSGQWQVQPLHVEDLVSAIQSLLERPLPLPPSLDLVGPEVTDTDGLTATLCRWLRLAPRSPVTVPEPLLRLAAKVGTLLPASSLTPETIAMLSAGSTSDPQPAADAIGWRARPLTQALATEPAVAADRWHARLLPLRPVLRGSLAALWIGSGLMPVLVTPAAVNSALLAGLGLHGSIATAALWGGALVDLAIGLSLLLAPRRTAWVGAFSLAVTLAFTVLATFAAPMLWAHPFAPLLKNLSIVAATLALMAMED